MTYLPKVLQQRMTNMDAPAVHPDSSLLTGFVERVLPPRMRVEVIDHLALCSECRWVVALAKSSAAEAVAPAQVVYGGHPWGWKALRWASGLATAAVVAGSLFVVRTVWVARHSPQDYVIATSIGSRPVQQQSAPEATRSALTPSIQARRASPSRNTGIRNVPLIASSDHRPMMDTGTNVNEMFEVGRRGNPVTGISTVPAIPSDIPPSPATSNVLWKVAGPGMVYESFDGGQRWQSVMIRGDVVFRCVTSVGSTVWVGGDAGTLYRSDDNGLHWATVALFGDTQALPTDPITRIEFADLQHGTVTTALGREWLTTDGGQTWKTR
jgi:Photosynthesis system II assembly factor YCF48/Putative zinc-finger